MVVIVVVVVVVFAVEKKCSVGSLAQLQRNVLRSCGDDCCYGAFSHSLSE